MAKKIKIKPKWKNINIIISFIIFCVFFALSSIKIINYIIDSKKLNNTTQKINDQVIIKEVKDNQNEIITQKVDVPKENPYWDYIKMNLIDVDFSKLKKTNNDVVGWITVNGTNINYPFVQTDNNNYYLSHSINKQVNVGGWVFMDYRNKLNSMDTNTILYAHGMTNKTMFGTLKKIFTNGWFDNPNNFIIKLSTEYENSNWQVFSAYRIPNTSDYLQINFNKDEEIKSFIDLIKNRSYHNFNTDVLTSDKILTLSTCYNNDEKVVIHAKLIKKEIKNQG
jgi:sortase B